MLNNLIIVRLIRCPTKTNVRRKCSVESFHAHPHKYCSCFESLVAVCK